ncbi:outer membrane protein [Aestuariivirga sp.]|uniref:outer membrane protein n=1 Tax=Aestuariivirga sp. TaxID=2650926 RepID=UPI003BA89330
MKKVLIAASTAATMFAWSSIAHASDMGFAPSSYDWSGGYVGVNAGVGIDMSKLNSRFRYTGPDEFADGDDTPDLIHDLSSSEDGSETVFTGGINAGYNWQLNHFVVGFEGDFNYLAFNSNTSRNVSDVMDAVFTDPSTKATDSFHMEGDWYGTFRGRLGYAANNILLYGTGGLAYGKLNVSQKLDAYNDAEYANWSGSNDGWRLGWTLGAGVEYGIDRWTLGAEYLYVDMGSVDWTSAADVSTGEDVVNDVWSDVEERGSVDYRFSVVRATLKYRF